MMLRNSRTSSPLSVEVCARAEIIEELKSAETKALVTTDIKSPRAITETPVLLQSLVRPPKHWDSIYRRPCCCVLTR
jgi:hypothetical protein